MKRGDLERERKMERMRGKWVQAEINRMKREEAIKSHINDIIDVMTAILFVTLIFVAFFIDGFGIAKVPEWFFLIGIVYLLIYLALTLYRMDTKGGKKK